MSSSSSSLSSSSSPSLLSPGETVLYTSFSLEHDSITIGTTNGWGMGIKIVEILMRSNVVALVGGGPVPKWSQDTLVLWDDHENKEISSTNVGEPIRSVKIRKELILVTVYNRVILYSNSLKQIGTISTTTNPSGISCISNSPGSIFIAALGTSTGTISLQKASLFKDDRSESDDPTNDSWELSALSEIKAHQSGIAAMCISNDGSFVATASEKGTIVRLYKVADGKLLKEFRRGMKPVSITGLAFSSDNSLLLASSNTGTVHLFDLTEE